MAFGAFTACLCNVTWHLPLVLSVRARDGCDGAAQRANRRSCCGVRCDARQAGFMSLFLASIGLALVLREAHLPRLGASVARLPRSTLQGVRDRHRCASPAHRAPRSSSPPSRSCSSALMLGRTDLGRAMRAMSDDRTLAQVAGMDTRRIIMATWILTGAARRPRRRAPRARPVVVRPELRLPAASSRSSRQSCSAGSAAPMARSAAASRSGSQWSSPPGGLRGRGRPGVQAGRRLRRADPALLVRPQGLFGKARTA